MKKSYIQPATIQIILTNRVSILLEGSMTVTADKGHATFYNEQATGDALTKSSSVWDDDWNTE